MSAKKAGATKPKSASISGSKQSLAQNNTNDAEDIKKLTADLLIERKERNYFQIERVALL